MDALHGGASMNDVFNLPVREKIARMRYFDEKNIDDIDSIEEEIKSEIGRIMPVGGDVDVA
jgi:V/A-type H+-transporting ATPase subunit A